MAIIRWKPLNVGQFLTEDFPELRVPTLATSLATDVYEKDSQVVVEMNLPGVNPDSLDIIVEDNYVHITGNREETKEEEHKNYYYKEIQRGSFERTVRLPAPIKKEKTEASFEDGILTITLPKLEEKITKVKVSTRKKPAKKIEKKPRTIRKRK